jgi:WD40 repeat protein
MRRLHLIPVLLFLSLAACNALPKGVAQPLAQGETSAPQPPAAPISPVPLSPTAMTPATPTPITSAPITPTLEIHPITLENAPRLRQLAQVSQGAISAVRWSPDGKSMALAGGLGIYLQDAATLQDIRLISTEKPVASFEFSPDGHKLLVTHPDKTGAMLDVAGGGSLYTFEAGDQAHFNPSGDSFMVGQGDERMEIRDVQTGRVLHEFKLDVSDRTSLSPDLRMLMASNFDGTRAVDTDSGTILFSLNEDRVAIAQTAFSPDGLTVAISVSGKEDAIRLYDAKTGKLKHTLEGQFYSFALAFSPDGSRLAAGGGDNTIQMWDTNTGQRLYTLSGQAYSYALAFSPNGQWLAVGSRLDNSLKIWDVATGQVVRTLPTSTQGTRRIESIAFSPAGDKLLIDYMWDLWQVWDANTGQLLEAFDKTPPDDFIFAGSQLFVSGAIQTTIWQWQPATGQLVLRITLPTQPPVAVSSDGKMLATGRDDFTIQIFNTVTGRPVSSLAGHAGRVTGLAFSPDGTILASSGEKQLSGSGPGSNSELRLWQVSTGKLLSARETDPWAVTVRGFFTQNSLLTTRFSFNTCGRGGGASDVALWNVDDLRSAPGGEIKPVWSNGGIAGGTSIALSADRRVMASSVGTIACPNTLVHVRAWDTGSGAPLTDLTFDNVTGGHEVALNPDGTVLAAGLGDGTFGLWDARTGQPLHTFTPPGQANYVTSLIYNPDGSLLIAGESDGAIQVWDAASRQLVHSLEGHTTAVTKFEFADEGRLLISKSDDGTVRLWGVAD